MRNMTTGDPKTHTDEFSSDSTLVTKQPQDREQELTDFTDRPTFESSSHQGSVHVRLYAFKYKQRLRKNYLQTGCATFVILSKKVKTNPTSLLKHHYAIYCKKYFCMYFCVLNGLVDIFRCIVQTK